MDNRRKTDSQGSGESGMHYSDTPVDGKAAAWDPYQVWLTRVKQPRDQTTRMRKLERQGRQPQLPTDTSETARLRALTAAQSR